MRCNWRSSEGMAAHRVGRKLPRKSEASVCWLQLTMCRWRPAAAAAAWHTVVLPVPVSPTSSTGSWKRSALHAEGARVLWRLQLLFCQTLYVGLVST